jgi:hypothetical protein
MAQLAMPNCREAGGFGRSHSRSFDHRLRPDKCYGDRFLLSDQYDQLLAAGTKQAPLQHGVYTG